MIKAVLFDVDGTLLDTTEYIFQALEHTLSHHEILLPERSEFSTHIGKPLADIYEIFAPGIEYEALRERHDNFQKSNLHLAIPFSGVFATIAFLKQANIKIAAVTTRGKINVLNTLEQTGLLPHLEVIITGDDVANHKPHPEPILMALDKLELSPENAFMVGDAGVDILAGKSAGTKTIGVTYGFGGHAIAEYQPDYLISNIDELSQIIELSSRY